MGKDIVKYSNWLNNLSFAGFGQVDFNLFMYLCAEMKNEDVRERQFSFTEIRSNAGLERHSNSMIAAELDRMTSKLMRVTCRIETDSEIIKFVLFPTFRINEDEGLLTVAVNPEFKFVLNSLASQFTQFELQEFVRLESKYAKTLYRLLKQYKTTGDRTIKADEFREKLCIPKSYPNKDIAAKIIEPTIRVLANSFPDLQYEVIKASRKGAPVRAYRFSFSPEAPDRQRTLFDSDRKQPEGQQTRSGQKKNAFNRIEQHDYDFNEIEAAILDE